MNRNRDFFLIILFCTALLSSCKTPTLYTSIDVLRAAKVEFQPNVEKLLIVNNSMVQAENFGHTERMLDSKPKKTNVKTDSLAIFALSVLAQEIQENFFFSDVLLQLNSIKKDKNFHTVSMLNSQEVKKLCEEYGVDAILSLDLIEVTDKLSEYYLKEDFMYLQELEAKCKTQWSIYHQNQVAPKSVHFKDSLFWEAVGDTRKQAARNAPSRKDALIDLSLEVGKNSAKRFVPYWEKQERYFFNPKNKIMRQAMDSVFVKNWQAAIELFSQAEKATKNKVLKAQAENNIAISYEFLGDFDKAYEYALLSLKTFGAASFVDENVKWQLSILTKELFVRKDEFKSLKKQLGEE